MKKAKLIQAWSETNTYQGYDKYNDCATEVESVVIKYGLFDDGKIRQYNPLRTEWITLDIPTEIEVSDDSK